MKHNRGAGSLAPAAALNVTDHDGDRMDAKQLQRAEAAYQAAARRAEQAREARNAAVRQAIADGMTHADIARATGLTRGRIGQLATESARPSP